MSSSPVEACLDHFFIQAYEVPNKKAICRPLKKTQRPGARRSMSGGVLFLYVYAKSAERNAAYEAFSAAG
jgi:hypothetical protein